RVTADQFLAPVALDQRPDAELGPVLNKTGTRCSDKGFLPMSLGDYLQLLDWTGRQLARGKKGRIPATIEPILQRLQLDRPCWCDLVQHFGRRFFVVAGAPATVDDTTSRVHQHRHRILSATRQMDQDVARRTNSRVSLRRGVRMRSRLRVHPFSPAGRQPAVFPLVHTACRRAHHSACRLMPVWLPEIRATPAATSRVGVGVVKLARSGRMRAR
ncbi:MAG: hypothetical protein JSS02_02970, partial [Planctomycetes bacterium]|nr:hypothetical protein [Planctomycetota bacterium]